VAPFSPHLLVAHDCATRRLLCPGFSLFVPCFLLCLPSFFSETPSWLSRPPLLWKSSGLPPLPEKSWSFLTCGLDNGASLCVKFSHQPHTVRFPLLSGFFTFFYCSLSLRPPLAFGHGWRPLRKVHTSLPPLAPFTSRKLISCGSSCDQCSIWSGL